MLFREGETIMHIREFRQSDIPQMIRIWNEIVEEGTAFPQEETLDEESGATFFRSQTRSAVAEENGVICGLYILHPNNIGRCGHLSNASYAVASAHRGKRIGRLLVSDCMEQARKAGYRVLQFNAVVADNTAARRLYESLGFRQLGTIPGGFRKKDGTYADICPYYISLV